MNSTNWYNIYKQASPPLPVTIPEDYESFPGVNEIDQNMSYDTADKEQDASPDIKFLGAGEYGMAVDIGDNKVVKYTTQENEANAAEKLIGNTTLPVVKVFKVTKIQLHPPIWAIEMEKLRPYNKFNIDDKSTWTEHPNNDYGKWRMESKRMKEELFPYGLSWDVWPRNVGWNSEGRLVLFDLHPSIARSNERKREEMVDHSF